MEENKQYAGLRRHSMESNLFVKDCLKKAMVQLAKETDYKNISVTRLCTKAGVSRMAFYRNYNVTNDVMYEIAYELNDDVVKKAGSPFRQTTSLEWYTKVFQMISEQKEAMALMFHENFQAQWIKIVNNFAVYDSQFPEEKKYQRIMWSGGFENVVSYWLNSGMKETPEELALYCVRYLPHMLKEE